MDDIFQPLANRLDEVLTAVITEKTKSLDIDHAFPLILTAKECQRMLGIGNYQEFQRITHLPGFPKIDKGKGSQIRYPRDAVRNWVAQNWQAIA